MKKLIQVICLTFLASVVSAQEDYTISISNPVTVAEIDLGRQQHNSYQCASLALLEGCSQADVCVAAGVAGGASCTPLQAILAGRRIYPDSLAGRTSFIGNELVRAQTVNFVQKAKLSDLAKARAFCTTATQIQKDAICAAFGLTNGCLICPLQ